LKRCGNPHHDLPVIHIAGTNGKGSTAAMTASILRATGRKVGLYTSPHLVRFNERIRVGGTPISDEWIVSFLKKYRVEIDTLGSTFFETTTAIMFSYFADEAVDIAVVEVGMGGRLDSSNVSESIVSVLTPIDFDHMEFLGGDLPSIAREKCGILKRDVPVVAAPQHEKVMSVIKSSSKEKGCPLFLISEVCPVTETVQKTDGSRFSVGETSIDLPLFGKHQVINAQTSIAACSLFDPKISDNVIKTGLTKVVWPGRLQKLSGNPLAYYDVGHNPHGISAAVRSLREIFPKANFGAVCGFKKNKDLDSIITVLKQYFNQIITVQPNHAEFYSADTVASLLQKAGIPAEACQSVTEGLKRCKVENESVDLWLIFGTHFIAEDVFSFFHFPFDKGEI
jgi:dihydrofolate synthase/folylpolyglutamate synthase